MKPPWHICVLIPARNEETLLPRCLASVLAARTRLSGSATVDIVVAVDSSTDRTKEIALDMLGSRGKVVSTQAGCVGAARHLAARTALARYEGGTSLCWLANTDADTSVPGRWLSRQLELADNNVEAVAGIVNVDNFQEHDPSVRSRFRQSYLLSGDGSHSHVHGANLGVRADAYLRAGGWQTLSTAEDHDLWNRLGHVGANRRSVSLLRVTTSGRRIGRAPHGFADALSAHNPDCSEEAA